MLILRRATDEDCVRFYRWWSDRETQRFTGTPACRLKWERHLAWFVENLANPYWFVGELEGRQPTPVGAVRFDRKDDDQWWVSIVVDPLHRGKGLGRRLIVDGTWAFREAYAESGLPSGLLARPAVYARIHQFNLASMAAFEAAGYVKHADGAPWLTYRKD